MLLSDADELPVSLNETGTLQFSAMLAEQLLTRFANRLARRAERRAAAADKEMPKDIEPHRLQQDLGRWNFSDEIHNANSK
jgi:hypothetical protein